MYENFVRTKTDSYLRKLAGQLVQRSKAENKLDPVWEFSLPLLILSTTCILKRDCLQAASAASAAASSSGDRLHCLSLVKIIQDACDCTPAGTPTIHAYDDDHEHVWINLCRTHVMQCQRCHPFRLLSGVGWRKSFQGWIPQASWTGRNIPEFRVLTI